MNVVASVANLDVKRQWNGIGGTKKPKQNPPVKTETLAKRRGAGFVTSEFCTS